MTVMMARLRGVGGEENDLSLWTDENTTMKVRDTGNHTHYIIDSDQHSWPTHTNTHTHSSQFSITARLVPQTQWMNRGFRCDNI